MRAFVAAVVVGAAFVSCGTPRTRLNRITLWPGEADCRACQAQAITLWPTAPSGVSLKRDSVYTAQLELDASGDADRCIFKFIGGTWEMPSRSFDCDPERPVIRRRLSTVRTYGPTGGGDRLGIRVSVLSSTDTSSIALLLDSQTFEVTWLP